jgi:hypothetical protein
MDYQLEKQIWTVADFDLMNWHDATIHAIAFSPETYEFSIDIDYIFEWIEPEANETYYKFMVSPATIVFENVNELMINVDEPYRTIQIQSIERDCPRKPSNADYIDSNLEWKWIIDAESAECSFYSIGYKQFIRQLPIQTQTQTLTMFERGGISFQRSMKSLV